jgi:hypothetical protein
MLLAQPIPVVLFDIIFIDQALDVEYIVRHDFVIFNIDLEKTMLKVGLNMPNCMNKILTLYSFCRNVIDDLSILFLKAMSFGLTLGSI